MERPSGPPSLAQQFTFSKTPLEGDGVGGRQSSEYRDSALRSPYVPVGISGSIVITGIKHGTEPKAANKEEAPLPRSGASPQLSCIDQQSRVKLVMYI